MQKARLDAKLPILNYKDDPSLPYLKEAPSQPLQQILKDLDRALKEAFQKKKGFPRFKKKFHGDSCRYPQGSDLLSNAKALSLPKFCVFWRFL